jgi:hypothetical protein
MAEQNSFRLFGFKITRADEDDSIPESPITPNLEDGAINIQTGAHYGVYVDLDGTYRTEVDLITKYRTMSMQPEMESAIEDIVNEAIVHDDEGKIVRIELEDLKQPDSIKKKIRDEFDECLRLLDFNNFGGDIFRRWYVDGRTYYNVVIDKDNPRDGIKTLIYVDPRRIRKIRNITKVKNAQGVEVIDRIDTFYLYNEKVVNSSIQSPQIVGSFAGGVKLSEDSVIHLTSGLFDPAKSTVLSYLHKAIRPMNQLRFLEDATVIYRVSRAPERRVFYVDVGNLPKMKAEQYLKDMMNKFRNKLVYDAGTGEIKDQTRHMSMLEDFWMPRRGEGKNTEITTLPAGQNLGQMEDVLYMEKKLYKALGVPASRLENNQGFSLGRSSEITRDELKFDKFVDKLRARFSILFDELLARQLSLKGICTLDEWNEFKMDIHYNFIKDNNFTELKEAELLTNRVNLLMIVDPYIGRFFSKRWVQEKVLMFDEKEIEDMEEEMDKENEEMAKDAEKMAGPPADPMASPAGSPAAPGAPAPTPAANPEELNQRAQQAFGDSSKPAGKPKPKKP